MTDGAIPVIDTQFRVLLLGSFGLERDGIAVDTSVWQPRVRTLLTLLVTAPERQRLRDDLIEVLWPEIDPERGAGNLRMLVHRLRLTLGAHNPSPVHSAGGLVRLNADYGWALDIEQLETVLRDVHDDPVPLETAARLYRGEPLAEERYADWAAPLRAHAQMLWRELCLRLARIHRARGGLNTSISWLNLWLEVDPLDEEVVCCLLTTLREAGKSTEALRYYARFEGRMQEDIGAPPAPEMTELVADIRKTRHEHATTKALDGESAPAPEPLQLPTHGGPLVARESELRQILLAAEEMGTKAGRLVLLVGEAGVGKTRLAHEVIARLHERGHLVVVSACTEQHRAVAYQPLLEMLAQVYAAAPPRLREEAVGRWPQLAWLLPDEIALESTPRWSDDDEQDEQMLLFGAIAGLLIAMAALRPIVMLHEDLHWADEGTLELLDYLAKRIRSAPIFLLATARDSEIDGDHGLNALTRRLAREGLLDRVGIGRFNAEETAALVSTLLEDGAGSDDFADFVYRRTKGNPYFVSKIVGALGGRYHLIRDIGSGGMGRVFEAIDARTGERVAVKIVFATTQADPKAMLRFRQEAQILAALDHPNVVRVREAIVEGYVSSIVMDLIAGRPLGHLMQTESLSLARFRHLVSQIAAGLAAAHERGIVHRDVKPDNVMVGPDDTAIITDFGIARLLRSSPPGSTQTRTGMTLGTPWYAAPEQVEGREVDGRADVYALGALMYHLVAGRPPFDGGTPLAIAFAHVHEAPLPPRILNSDVPPDWEAVILRALAKDPNDRYESMASMARAVCSLSVESPGTTRIAGSAPEPAPGPDNTAWAVTRPSPRRLGLVRRLMPGALAAALILASLLTFGPRVSFATFALPFGNRQGTAVGLSEGSGPGQFRGPTGIAVDSRGHVFVVDRGNNRFQEFTSDGVPIRQCGSPGNSDEQFEQPSDLALAPDGAVWVVDHGNQRITKFRSCRQEDARDLDASGLAIDGHGTVYAPTFYHHRMQVLHQNGGHDYRWPVPTVGGGRFEYPDGLVVGRDGTIYMADRLNGRIEEFSPRGRLLRLVGSYGQELGRFDVPTDVTLDRQGNIYVADARNNRIQKLSPSGRPLAAWGTFGRGPGQFIQPDSVAVDAGGNMYVSDFYNDRVQKLSPSGRPIWATNGETPIRFGSS